MKPEDMYTESRKRIIASFSKYFCKLHQQQKAKRLEGSGSDGSAQRKEKASDLKKYWYIVPTCHLRWCKGTHRGIWTRALLVRGAKPSHHTLQAHAFQFRHVCLCTTGEVQKATHLMRSNVSLLHAEFSKRNAMLRSTFCRRVIFGGAKAHTVELERVRF